jgi:hypothetical protein
MLNRNVLERSIYSLKMSAFWDIVSCSLVEVDRHFRDAYCLHREDDQTSETRPLLQNKVHSKNKHTVISSQVLYSRWKFITLQSSIHYS